MNNLTALFGDGSMVAFLSIVGILILLLILLLFLTAIVLDIRTVMRNLNKHLQALVSLSPATDEKKEHAEKERHKLKLDNQDLEKLKDMGVGMD